LVIAVCKIRRTFSECNVASRKGPRSSHHSPGDEKVRGGLITPAAIEHRAEGDFRARDLPDGWALG
jgi:hypothetical protein